MDFLPTQCDVDFGGSLLNLVYSKPSPSGDRDIVLVAERGFRGHFRCRYRHRRVAV
ncbi:MAG: hypothetical protein R3E12_20165 [Candidatus Eisenbacteria bacterium]